MSDTIEIKWLGELQRCDVKPGEKFVLNVDAVLTMANRDALQRIWRNFIGADDGHELLILEKGMKIGVLGSVEAEPT